MPEGPACSVRVAFHHAPSFIARRSRRCKNKIAKRGHLESASPPMSPKAIVIAGGANEERRRDRWGARRSRRSVLA